MSAERPAAGAGAAALARRLELARNLARRAGALAQRYFQRTVALEVERKGPQDYVSAGDTAVEAMIRGELEAAFPEDTVYGEEAGGRVGPSTWFVDPIDGTANFVHGVRYYCISMGLVVGGRRAIGVIYDPPADELFWSGAGHGAWCNDSPLQVSGCARLADAYLANGYVPRHDREHYLGLRRRLLEAGAIAKDMGAGALMLAHVAAGRYDGFYEPHMHSWDAVAGLALIEAAGGVVAPYPGPEGFEAGGEVLAAGPRLFPLLREITAHAP